MTAICLATTLADRPRELLEKGSQLWPALRSRFSNIVVHVTETTHSDWIKFFEAEGVPTAISPSGWDVIGLHRRRSLSLAITHTDNDWILYADLDHVLRWVERHPEDLDGILEQVNGLDCLVIGRSKGAFASAPRRLRETEAIVNQIYALITGNSWDLMMAARGLSRAAAALIVDSSEEDTIGNDVAWPMLCEINGLALGYAESDGLRYETNEVYANGVADIDDLDADAWILRVKAAFQHVEAMKRFRAEYRSKNVR